MSVHITNAELHDWPGMVVQTAIIPAHRRLVKGLSIWGHPGLHSKTLSQKKKTWYMPCFEGKCGVGISEPVHLQLSQAGVLSICRAYCKGRVTMWPMNSAYPVLVLHKFWQLMLNTRQVDRPVAHNDSWQEDMGFPELCPGSPGLCLGPLSHQVWCQ
jgi:hypothetical protein